MNKQDLQKVLEYARYHTFEVDDFCRLSGGLADQVHNTTGKICASIREVACLFKWQCIQLNGEWDMNAVRETMDWLRNRIEIIYPPEPVIVSTDRASLMEV